MHFRVILSGTFYGQVWQNVLHFEDEGVGLTREEVAITIRDIWLPNHKAGLPADVFFTLISVYDADDVGLGPISLTIALQGSQSADTQLVPFACWVLQFKTASGGRHGHGRIFLPGVLKGFHFVGVMTAGGASFWAAAINALKNNFLGSNINNLKLQLQSRGSPHVYRDVTDIVMRPTMGAQRRRNIGVGM